MTVWLAGQPATADIDPAEYQLQSSVRNDKERKRLQRWRVLHLLDDELLFNQAGFDEIANGDHAQQHFIII